MFLRVAPLIGSFFVAWAVGACQARTGKIDDGYDTEVEGCTECKGILVECSSTSNDEDQFVECRDQWLKCQRARSLGPDECRNPGDAESCELCRGRLGKCKAGGAADAAKCEAEFGVCKAFLITRGDVARSCTQDSKPPPQVACSICKKDYASCVSDGAQENGAGVCDDKFGQCLSTNSLAPNQCSAPSGGEGCLMCKERHTGCVAAAGQSCSADFDACKKAIAPLVDCNVTGGGGEGGSGGSGGTPSACAHSACVEGAALVKSCNACATQVCTQDSWCCDYEWDAYCVDMAKNVTACGCP